MLCLIIKPAAVKDGLLGHILGLVEASGLRVEDMFALDITHDDIYQFFELHLKYPNTVEAASYMGGMCVVVGFKDWYDFKNLEKHYPVYFSPSRDAGKIDYKFWFGSQ